MLLDALENFRHGPSSGHSDLDRTVLIQNGRTITARELSVHARALAGALAKRNIAEGDRVALVLPNCKELVIALAACARLGAIAAPLDPAWTPPELARALAPLAPRCVFGLGRNGRALEGAIATAEIAPPLVVRIDKDLEGALPTDDGSVALDELLEARHPAPDRAPERAAFVAHTAWRGRGRPHFAVRSADAALEGAVLAARATGLVATTEGRGPILAAAPFHRPGALELQLLAPLVLGVPVVVLKQLRARMALKLAITYGTSVAIAPPALLALMARLVASGAEPTAEAIRLFVATSAPPPTAEQAEVIERTFQAPLVWGYSPAEAPWALVVPEGRRALPPSARGLGEPVGETEIDLGEGGQLFVRSRRGAHEFLGETPEDRPTLLGVRTGDRGVRVADGTLFLVPREDVATVAAYEVDLMEVAETLRRHPAVALAQAFAVPDPEMGSHVRAVVTLAPGAEASVGEVVDFLRDRLCYYKIPQSFRFRRLDRPA